MNVNNFNENHSPQENGQENYPVVSLAKNFKAWKVEKLCLNDFFLKLKIQKELFLFSNSDIIYQWDGNWHNVESYFFLGTINFNLTRFEYHG